MYKPNLVNTSNTESLNTVKLGLESLSSIQGLGKYLKTNPAFKDSISQESICLTNVAIESFCESLGIRNKKYSISSEDNTTDIEGINLAKDNITGLIKQKYSECLANHYTEDINYSDLIILFESRIKELSNLVNNSKDKNTFVLKPLPEFIYLFNNGQFNPKLTIDKTIGVYKDYVKPIDSLFTNTFRWILGELRTKQSKLSSSYCLPTKYFKVNEIYNSLPGLYNFNITTNIDKIEVENLEALDVLSNLKYQIEEDTLLYKLKIELNTQSKLTKDEWISLKQPNKDIVSLNKEQLNEYILDITRMYNDILEDRKTANIDVFCSSVFTEVSDYILNIDNLDTSFKYSFLLELAISVFILHNQVRESLLIHCIKCLDSLCSYVNESIEK
jgi:hypothetical protein